MRPSQDVKSVFERELDVRAKLHRSGKGGVRVSIALAQRLDRLINFIFTDLAMPQKRALAVVGLGGYGRYELCFASDTDVMFLVSSEKEKAEAVEVAKEFIHRLFDNGLTVGHSFRSIQECLEFQNSDVEIWTSLLESRFICGNQRVFRSLHSGMQKAVDRTNKALFVKSLLTLSTARHEKFGASTKLLEPNVKVSAGGLRDLHTVLWLVRGTGTLRLPQKGSQPAVVQLLNSRVIQRLLPSGFTKQPQRSFDFLLRVRNEMHRESKSLHDTLDFLFQPQVAEGLGYRPTKRRSRVEHFMQDYYVTARAINLLYQRVLAWVTDRFLDTTETQKVHRLDDSFVQRGNRLAFRTKRARLTNVDALRAFLHSANLKVPLSLELEDSLYRSLNSFRPLHTPMEAELFRQLLKSGRVAEAFRRINELGLLARWIPEWAPMVAYFQHNVYHYYTVD